NKQASTETLNSFLLSIQSFSNSEIGYFLLTWSNKMFFTTLFFTNNATFPLIFRKVSIIIKVINSAISKLPLPVIASKPLWFLKFLFLGRLSELRLPSFEFVTQGGLPITKILFLAFSFAILLKLKSKTLQCVIEISGLMLSGFSKKKLTILNFVSHT